jgi:hypothetical protein
MLEVENNNSNENRSTRFRRAIDLVWMKRNIVLILSSVCIAFAAINSATAAGQPAARLIVQRTANFGTNLVIRLSIDGRHIADIPQAQHYGGFLSPGRHVISALSLPNTESRRPTSVMVIARPGQLYIYTALWYSDRLLLRPSTSYSPTTRVTPLRN